MPRPRHGTFVSIAALVGAVGVVACTLNPQPLPPDDDRDPTRADPSEQAPGAGTNGDGSSPTVPQPKPADAGSFQMDGSAGSDAGRTDAAVDATVDGGDDGSTTSDASAD